MKKWQETRNYKRIKDQNGIIINIITVDGVDVEVNDEVFLAYSQADRRERYIIEEVEAGKLLSKVPSGIHPVQSSPGKLLRDDLIHL